MTQITITDDEAQKVLAQGIRLLIDKHTDYFFSKQQYQLDNIITESVRQSMSIIIKEEVIKMLEEKNIREEARKVIGEKLNGDFINTLVNKITIGINSY